jgi:hypothetical protein
MLTTDQVIALAAALIALAALGIAVWEGVMSRRHDRLSVGPLLVLRHHLGGSRGSLGLTISNEGLGPAVVTKCILEVDGEPCKEDGDNGWEAAISLLGLRDFRPRYTTVAPDGIIRPGDTVWLLSTTVTEDHVSGLSKALSRLNVRVSYESIYKDRKVATYRS